MTNRWYLGDTRALAGFAVPAGPAGLVLGRDNAGEPVAVRVFRPRPTKVAMVGGRWAAWLLASRALAVGARLVVRTATPENWNGLGQWATGRADRCAVVSMDAQVAQPTASDTQPLLEIMDSPDPARVASPVYGGLGPWHTELTLVHQLMPGLARLLSDVDLTIVQCLTAMEASIAAGPLRLPDRTVEMLQLMSPDMLAVMGGDADHYLWTQPTAIEQQSLGPARRVG